jgi:hypothetical protein
MPFHSLLSHSLHFLFLHVLLDTFTDFTTSASEETQLTGSLTKSFAYDALKTEISESQESSATTSKTQYVVSSMSIERFYASVREEISPIIPEGLALLERKDYVGFFMSCGSNYIRSIRRKQEVTGIFKFETTSVSTASAFASSLKTNIADEDGDGRQSSNSATSTKFDNVNSSLEIKILGYGLGLSQEGAGTLVANDLSEFNAVMDFAFRAMTQSGGGSMDIGMVYGVEVVPWVDNVQFQTNAKVTQENIEVPLARSLIPRAFNATNRFDFYNKNTDYNLRDQFRCKEAAHTIDMYGYCCEFASIYDNIEQIYEPSSPETKSCRPLQQLDGSMVKNNMASNAEFVIRLDQVLRLKLNNFALVEQCIGQVSGIPSRTDNYILKQKAIAEYNSDLMAISVLEMKMVMDPFGDFGLLTHVGFEINEYIAMFYQRCITAMFGSGAPGETSAFLTAPWTGHSECMHLSCLGTLNRWSRDGAGCVPGILAGTGATEYKPDEEITQCVLDPDGTGDVEECLYKTHTLNQFQVRAKDCWNNMKPDGGVNAMYMIDNFCLPLVGQDKADEKYPDEYQQILGSVGYCGTIADIEDTSE